MMLKKSKKLIIFLLTFLALSTGVFAQDKYAFPLGDFWALDAGFGMSGILVKGTSYNFIIDPRLWLSPKLMVGARAGLNLSVEKVEIGLDYSNILTFEGQVYMRWNFLQFGKKTNPLNLFLQGGLGLIASYRGDANPFDNVEKTRGSLMGDVALGLTIPLSARWHLETQVRGGYPHIFGFTLTAGYKFPLPEKKITTYSYLPGTTQYIEVMKAMPPEELIKRVMITSIEYILFGPDIGEYNVGIDRDAQQLNEMVLDQTAKMLKENPSLRVRLEGHANPYTINVSEIDELMTLSALRTDNVTAQLKQRGVTDEQMVLIHYGGTRTVTSEWDLRNRNRRVEMIIIQVDDI